MSSPWELYQARVAAAVAESPNNQTIYKYPFEVTDRFTLALPQNAQILHVDVQRGQPCIWARVQPTNEDALRHFRIVGTGHPIQPDEKLYFIGTFMLEEGALVFHLFETT